jgi:hypothetical protein
MRAPFLWLGPTRGYLADWVTQVWVKATGRRICLDEVPWLQGPGGTTRSIGDAWFRQLAADLDADLAVNSPGAGLLDRFDDLRGPTFDPSAVDPEVVRFYERTTDYRLDVRPQWESPYQWGARVLMAVFARRLDQLNMPLSPQDAEEGLRSDIVKVVDRRSGAVVLTGWVRRVGQSGPVVYAGCYSVAQIPGQEQPVVKVLFPLPNGSASVFLTPRGLPDGSLELVSRGRAWGEDGFYFVVLGRAGRAWARPVALTEVLRVRARPGGIGTDHELRLWGRTFLRLHYRIVRTAA